MNNYIISYKTADNEIGVINVTGEDHSLPNIILLNVYRKRVEWVQLKKDVFEEYNKE